MAEQDRKPPPRRDAPPPDWDKLAEPLRKLARENPDAFAEALRGLLGRKQGSA
jgi:hypothetical protein